VNLVPDHSGNLDQVDDGIGEEDEVHVGAADYLVVLGRDSPIVKHYS
jgi:hypothetical protein